MIEGLGWKRSTFHSGKFSFLIMDPQWKESGLKWPSLVPTVNKPYKKKKKENFSPRLWRKQKGSFLRWWNGKGFYRLACTFSSQGRRPRQAIQTFFFTSNPSLEGKKKVSRFVHWISTQTFFVFLGKGGKLNDYFRIHVLDRRNFGNKFPVLLLLLLFLFPPDNNRENLEKTY